MASTLSLAEQVRQLDDARKLVLGDVKYYPSVVRGILPIIGPSAPVELRRWGAEFLAEAFSTPALPNGEKETMQPYVLTTLEAFVANEKEDYQVLCSVIQTASSIYPLALRWVINNGYDTITWDKMLGIKQWILRIWDNAIPSVKICCIKFAQRVVLAQMAASTSEFRHGGAIDVSLDKIPPNHQSLEPQRLEAEATGLLDRILAALQESSDALIVDATLNSLSILWRTRPAANSRILNALLTFNPAQSIRDPLTSKSRVMIKSMEKTARMLLIHLTKRDPHNPMVPRIQQQVERMMRTVAEALDGMGKKRQLDPQTNEDADEKRQRVSGSHVPIKPLGPGSHSLGDLFTIISSAGLKSFDVSRLPLGLVTKVSVNALADLDPALLSKAISGVRGRLQELANAPAQEPNPNTAPLDVDDDDDDYEPDFYQAEDTEQILNKLDGDSPSQERMSLDSGLTLAPFSLPAPSPLTLEAALGAGNTVIARVLDMMKAVEERPSKREKSGFNRLAASSGNRDAWTTMLTRLATRTSPKPREGRVKEEDDEKEPGGLDSHIRELLYAYVMEDFRKHIDIAISWLCEEWYNDKVRNTTQSGRPVHYEKCALRLIDGFLPYLHPQDKILTRFLGEIPQLSGDILSRLKHMCRDPTVTQLALTSLLYLVMMRPPVKEIALDTVQNIWTEFEDARPMAGKYLARFRPDFLERAASKEEPKPAASPSPATPLPA